MNVTIFIERKTGRIAYVDYDAELNAGRPQSAFGGPWGDPEQTNHIALEIPSEEYRAAIIPDGQGGAMLDPDWSLPVPEPTVEERLKAVEDELVILKGG